MKTPFNKSCFLLSMISFSWDLLFVLNSFYFSNLTRSCVDIFLLGSYAFTFLDHFVLSDSSIYLKYNTTPTGAHDKYLLFQRLFILISFSGFVTYFEKYVLFPNLNSPFLSILKIVVIKIRVSIAFKSPIYVVLLIVLN